MCCPEWGKLSERKVLKGFNFVSGKLVFGWAASRFAKPRKFPKRERFYSFRLYEKNQKYPRGLRTSGLRGRFKALSKKILAELSGGTCRTRLFAQNGGEKALNRCDTPVLQRKELERTEKEQRYSLVDSRLWLGANGRWRVEKGFSEWAIRKGLSKWIAFGLRKRATFRLMQNQPIKKSFF